MLRNKTTIDRFGNRLDLLHHFGKCLRGERLLAIGDRMCGIVVYFNNNTICAGSNTRSCNGGDIIGVARGMRRIDDDWQVC